MSKRLKGKVVSTKMQKTVVVAVEELKRHPVYGKVVKRTRKFKARDEIGVSLGDIVEIEECRPFSKEVSFKVTKDLSAQAGLSAGKAGIKDK